MRNFIAFISKYFKKKSDFEKMLRKILGFSPSDLTLYDLALTHKSVRYTNAGELGNNERLEYLGDAVLDAIVSEFLYHRFPSADEGVLTKVRSNIVNGKKLSEIAILIKLDSVLNANVNESAKKRILEDAFEALIGAIYLDKGYIYTKKFVKKQIIERFLNIEKLLVQDTNFKSKIIEWSQRHKIDIEYFTDFEDYSKSFFCSYLRINGVTVAKGRALSKKQAEQNAAQLGVIEIEKHNVERWRKE